MRSFRLLRNVNGLLDQAGDGVGQQHDGQAANCRESSVLGAFHAPRTTASRHVQKAGPGKKQRRGAHAHLGRHVEKIREECDDRGRFSHDRKRPEE
jgi:hypothetical protein